MLAPVLNKAAVLGPSKFPWWKDWRGERCVIVASGPSAKSVDLSPLKGKVRCIAVKQAYDLVPWCDVVYGCELPWWQHRHGLPEFKGLKCAFEPKVSEHYPDIKRFDIQLLPGGHKKYSHALLVEEPGVIGGGGNSGFQASNIAVQFGVIGIALAGFDASDRGAVHFYGRNNWARANNPDWRNFETWRKSFDVAANMLTGLGVEVINLSQHSAISAFRKASVADVIREWKLSE